MRRTHSLTLSLFLVVMILALGAGSGRAADVDNETGFTLLDTITVPNDPVHNPLNRLTSFDISWVDEPFQRYYLADRSNAGVDIIDARTNTFIGRVGGFVGFTGVNSTSGPDGIVVIHSLQQLWAGDGDSTVKVIDLKSDPPQIIDVISTGGTKRVDEMAFDPKDHIMVVANNADDPPFLTFISTKKDHQILGRLEFPGASGIEQSVWDPETHRVYLSVPDGSIAEIDPLTRTVTRTFPVLPCEPTGLTLGPNQHLLAGCDSQDTVVVDARTGDVVASFTQVGGADEVWFNRGDGNYYVAARNNATGPVLGIIDAATNTFLRNVPTVAGAHSVAADRVNNHVFVPLGAGTSNTVCPNGCIGVFGNPD